MSDSKYKEIAEQLDVDIETVQRFVIYIHKSQNLGVAPNLTNLLNTCI